MASNVRESVLQEADRIINGARRDDYGSPLESFEQVGKLWEPILGVAVSPIQVALCLLQLKVSRFLHGQQRDSAVDMGGYTGCLELILREMGVWE